jgi:hypothetical protein
MTNEQYSSATQAVMDAFCEADNGHYEDEVWNPADPEVQLAAALRAAAYVILPLDSPHIEDFPEDDDDSPSDRIRHLKKRIRNKFLAIAKELEGTE